MDELTWNDPLLCVLNCATFMYFLPGILPFGTEKQCLVLVGIRLLVFRTALMMTFALYYIMNIEYPESVAATLVQWYRIDHFNIIVFLLV